MVSLRIVAASLILSLAACQNGSTEADSQASPDSTANPATAVTSEDNGKSVEKGSAKERAEQATTDRIEELAAEVNVYSLYKYLETHPDFSLMFKVVQGTHYPKKLHSGSYTLIAPTDKAMKRLPDTNYEALMQPENSVAREEFVARHLIEQAIPSEKLDQLDNLNSADGARLVFGKDFEGDLEINGAQMTRTHVQLGKSILIATDFALPDGREK